jgi:hypothetical protein
MKLRGLIVLYRYFRLKHHRDRARKLARVLQKRTLIQAKKDWWQVWREPRF